MKSPFDRKGPFPPLPPQAAAFTVVISGSTVIGGTLTAVVDPVGVQTYQWFLDGVAIGGATSATFDSVSGGAHSCRVTRDGKSRFSNTINVVSGGGEFTFEFSDEFFRSV